MPTGPKGQRRPAHAIGTAVKVMRIATGDESEDFGPRRPEKNEAAAQMRRKGAASRAAKFSLSIDVQHGEVFYAVDAVVRWTSDLKSACWMIAAILDHAKGSIPLK